MYGHFIDWEPSKDVFMQAVDRADPENACPGIRFTIRATCNVRLAIAEPSRERTDTQRAIVPIFFFISFFLLLSRKPCRGSNRPRECLRVLANRLPSRAESSRAESCRESDFKERVTHMRVIYCYIKVERGISDSKKRKQ